ncbi:MAG: hypothetical protein ABI778_09515 [Ignavibacteriota bacterium]
MQEQFIYTEKDVKQMRIIIIALCCGVSFICLIAIMLGSAPMPSQQINGPETNDMALRIIHAVLSLCAIIGSKFIGDKILSGKVNNRGAKVQSPFMRYRSSVIIRIALLEGVTLFGAVIFLQASVSGSIDATYYLHLLPLPILLLSARSFYPTDFKLAELSRAFNTE